MKKLKVFIGGDMDRLKRLLEDLEANTRAVWQGSIQKPTACQCPGTIWLFFGEIPYYGTEDALSWASSNQGGTEVTPKEFIQQIKEHYPKKSLEEKLEDFLEFNCVYSGYIKDDEGERHEGPFTYWGHKLESAYRGKHISRITEADLTKLVRSEDTRHRLKEED